MVCDMQMEKQETGGAKCQKFASAHLQRKHMINLVQPYALRAPGVVMGFEWRSAIDIWRLGCLVLPLLSYTFLMINDYILQDVRMGHWQAAV